MGLADEQPELFGGRVQGVGLVATSSGRLSEVTFRLPARAARVMQGRTDQLAAAAMIARAERLDRRRTRTTDLEFLLTKRLSFGGPVSRGQARFVADLLDSTPRSRWWPVPPGVRAARQAQSVGSAGTGADPGDRG